MSASWGVASTLGQQLPAQIGVVFCLGVHCAGQQRRAHLSSILPTGLADMILTTTPAIQGYNIVQYRGIVTAHVIEGANALQDFAAKVSDIMGGRASVFEGTLQAAARKALNELRTQAEALGANAVVGIDLDYETIHVVGHLLMVVATGTAVSIKRSEGVPTGAGTPATAEAGPPAEGRSRHEGGVSRADAGEGPAFFGGVGRG